MQAASEPDFEPLPLEEAAPPAEIPLAPLPEPKREAVAPPAPPSTPAPVPAPAQGLPAQMDLEFISRNQIVERYLSGKLPIKGATDFERFCKEHPQLLDQLGLAERVNAGLRLLEASGKPEPWQEPAKKWWEKPQLIFGAGLAAVIFAIAFAVAASDSASKSEKITQLQKRATEQPLEATGSTRSVKLLPSRSGLSTEPALVIGGGKTELAELKIDMSRSSFRAFRVTIERVEQGRVMLLHNLAKDSNGHLRISLNSSALGPGNYQFTIEGLTWRGEVVPDAWFTLGIAR
jgi:hypothetical protein